MPKPSYTLSDDFEFKGLWWLPEKPDVKIAGDLKFKNDKKILLELLGSFHETRSLGAGNYFQPEIILGITNNGHICTLYKNFETGNHFNFPGIQNSIIESNILFVGKHFNKTEELSFSSFQARFTNLEKWLSHSPFSMQFPDMDKPAECILAHKWPPEFKAKIEKLNCVIESTHEFSTRGDLVKNATWKSKAYLKITPDFPKNYEWYRKIIYDLSNLLTLLIGETTYITSVKATGDEVESAPGKKVKEIIEIFFAQKKPNINDEVNTFEMLVPFPRIEAKIENVLSLWYSKRDKLQSVYDLYFGTFYNPYILSSRESVTSNELSIR